MTRHVLLYTDDPGMGGIAHYNHALLMGLADVGYQVTCVQSISSNPLVETRKERGIHHEWLYFDTTKDFGRTFSNGSDAQEIFTKLNPDLIIFSDTGPISNFAARQVALENGIPYVIVIGLVASTPEYHFGDGLNPKAYLDSLAQQFNRAKAVIAVSHDNLKWLHEQFHLAPELGQVILHGCPEAFFAPRDPQTRQLQRSELEIPADGIVCLTAARLEAVKGFQYQLDAILQLRDLPVWESLYFVWLGDGTLYDWLDEAIADEALDERVKLLGQRWNVADWLDAADLFILPSEVEGMPFAILEAMAKGVPAIASAVGGIPEALDDTGRLTPPPLLDPQATVDALVATIQELAERPDIRAALGEAAHQRAESTFRESRMLDETLGVVSQILESLPPRVVETPLPLPEESSEGEDTPIDTASSEADPVEVTPIVEVSPNLAFPDGDYVSQGYARVSVDRAFSHLGSRLEPWQRVPHRRYVDDRWPDLELLTRDELHLLYNTALAFAGQPALELGCRLGWSSCHLALGGVVLDVVDSALETPEWAAQVKDALVATGVADAVVLHAGPIPQTVEPLAAQRRWSLIVVNGEYTAPAPLQTAIACEDWAAPDALILFPNVAAPDVAQGLDFLRQRGWQTQIYLTAHIIGAAWRGNAQPIAHQPDPAIAWQVPSHLAYYRVSPTPTDGASSPSAAPSPSPKVDPAVPSQPDSERVHQVHALMRQAVELYNSDQREDALAVVEQAAALGVVVPDLHYLRSFCLAAVGRHQEGLEAAQAELALNPQHKQAKEQVKTLTEVLTQSVAAASVDEADPESALWRTELPPSLQGPIQQAIEGYTYRGVPLRVSPFDLAIAPLLMWEVKPRTILELGSAAGGRALWLGDLLNNFGIDGHVYSVNSPKVTGLFHPRVTYLEGDRQSLGETFSAGWLNLLPHPWLIIHPAQDESAATQHGLDFFHPYLEPNDYLIVESLSIAVLSGAAHPTLKAFLAAHPGEYDIDRRYCDVFGYNVTANLNGYLRKVVPPVPVVDPSNASANSEPIADSVNEVEPDSSAEPTVDPETELLAAVGIPSWDELIDLVELCEHDSPIALGRLRRVRQHLAYHWLGLPADELQLDYEGVLGRVQGLLLQSRLQSEPLTESEQALSKEIAAYLEDGLSIPGGLQHLIAGMLYITRSQPLPKLDLSDVPVWLLDDYLTFLEGRT